MFVSLKVCYSENAEWVNYSSTKTVNDYSMVYYETSSKANLLSEQYNEVPGTLMNDEYNFTNLDKSYSILTNFDSQIDINYVSSLSTEYSNCSYILGNPKCSKTSEACPEGASPAYYLTFAFKLIRYIAIGILVVLSVLDFITAISAQEDDKLRNAFNKLIKRVIMCIFLFVLPEVLEYVLTIISNKNIETCIGK